jgi:predicted metal-dependent RNase
MGDRSHMKVTFHGAARTTTGSMHLIETDRQRILLDCGLYQGRRAETAERNAHLPFDPKSVTHVILSHAHIDHSGNLPTLVKNGYAGENNCTIATVKNGLQGVFVVHGEAPSALAFADALRPLGEFAVTVPELSQTVEL